MNRETFSDDLVERVTNLHGMYVNLQLRLGVPLRKSLWWKLRSNTFLTLRWAPNLGHDKDRCT